ncbi:MAG: HDIG domain-containing protein [FCB group bacterium]|nr:HDIG domain-containing protein [FCB group bacterium]
MLKPLHKLKRAIVRLLKIKEDIDPLSSRRRSRLLIKYLIGIAGVVMITLLYPASELYGPLDVPRGGDIALENIIADFTFNIYKDEARFLEEKRLAVQSTPLFFDFNDKVAHSSPLALRQLFAMVDSLRSLPGGDSLTDRSEPLRIAYPYISGQRLEQLLCLESTAQIGAILDTILTDNIYFYGVLNDLSQLPAPEYNSIVMHKERRDLLMVRNQLLDLQRAYNILLNSLNEQNQMVPIDIELGYEIGRHFIFPNAVYNETTTQAVRDSAQAEISNVQKRVTAGDLLIRRGRIVDDEEVRLMQAYLIEMQKQAAARGWVQAALPVFGRMVLVTAIILLIYLFLYHFRPDVYWSNNKLFALFLIIALELFLVNFVGVRLVQSVYLFPIAILSILVTVLFDARLGVVITLLVALLLGVLNRFNFTITFITAVAGSVACFSAGEIRRRSEFYRIIIFLSLVYMIIAFIIESLKLSPAGDVLTYCGYGLINGFVAPMLTIGILPMFESLFGFSTNITLLELADLNQPLLKRLSMEAPGTYHHSIVLGTLAEAAAKRIGANPLLARVGAYYHDIGKMEIPEYFVENQLGIKSKHESLNPTMSALVISSHVKKGRRLGEDAGLPDAVLNFIEEHHGTTRMSYFYNKAMEMGMPAENEDEFRYPGPKPQTKETAIVMLADSTEAASRTLDNPTSARIRNLIQRLINDKFSSGELTQCDLTLKDLNDIREAFVTILIGVFHQRIAYPKKEEEETV